MQGDLLCAVVKNIYTQPVGKRRDGTSYGGQSVVQVEWTEDLGGGQKSLKNADLTVKSLEPYEGKVGQEVTLPLRVYVRDGRLFRSMRE